MSTAANEKKMLEIFKQFDTNGDGILSVDEVRDGFKEFMGDQIMFEEELQAIIKKADLNGNGSIEYSEFVAAATNLGNIMTEKNLK